MDESNLEPSPKGFNGLGILHHLGEVIHAARWDRYMELKHLMLMAEVHETLRLVVTEREIWKRAREHRANGNWGCPELNYVFSHGVYALLSRGLRRSRTIRLIRSGRSSGKLRGTVRLEAAERSAGEGAVPARRASREAAHLSISGQSLLT